MLEHGTLNNDWGWFDAASIHWFGLYTTLAVCYSWAFMEEKFQSNWVTFLVFFLVFIGFVTLIGATTEQIDEGRLIWIVINLAAMIGAVIADFCLWTTGNHKFSPPRAKDPWGYIWFCSAMSLFIAAMVLWVGANPHIWGVFCPPGYEHEHVFQAHAGFHLLAALAILCMWLYFVRRERCGLRKIGSR